MAKKPFTLLEMNRSDKLSSFKILIAIVIVAAFLRLYKLESYPVSLSWDEVAIGYNAFSIASTGKDEYGKPFPILFQSFNDFKLPGYIYIDAAIIKAFGLSEFTTRLPSALAGIAAVIAIYLIAKKLFDQKIALIASFFLAISPWHLQVSRAAFEANIALTFFLFGISFLLLGLKIKTIAFFSIPTLALSLYFYYSPRLLVPAILTVFLIIYRKEANKNLKSYILGFLIAITISIPITLASFTESGAKRIKEVSILADSSLAQDYSLARIKNNNPLSSIFLNFRIPYIIDASHRYFSHLSPSFLFFPQDPNPRHHSSFHGNFYIFEMPLILLGIWLVLKNPNLKLKRLLLLWIFVAPIPASLSQETPHTLRALALLPPFVILSAVGSTFFVNKKLSKKILIPIIIVFIVNYFYSYYVLYPIRDNTYWAYGYKQLFEKISSNTEEFDSFIISGHYWKPYIFYLYYNKTDPASYQKNSNQQAIKNIKFGTTYWDSSGQDLTFDQINSLKGQQTLLAISPEEFNLLEGKLNFQKITTIQDHSRRKNLFIIVKLQ